MPKNKRPVPRKSTPAPEADDDDILAQALADLAQDIAATGDGDLHALQLKESDFQKLVRNALRKKNDEVLYGAIERARHADVAAYQYLRSKVEEASSTVLIRREGAPTLEVDAFLLPLFVHSTGGLHEAEGFQDVQAFEALVASLREAGLESPQAEVVLISHAYDLDEVDRITYSQLAEMAREAGAAMGERKIVASPALESSIRGWSGAGFGPADEAMELRFLLGFSKKRADDPFYAVPAGETEAQAYFAARMARYRDWTVRAAPLVQRCLAGDPSALALNFLYQDLFFDAKEQAMAELLMLQMLSSIKHALDASATEPARARAIVAPADVDDQVVLRVNVLGQGSDAVLASFEKPLDVTVDLQAEVDDICEALGEIGLTEVSVAQRFDKEGRPEREQPYPGAH